MTKVMNYGATATGGFLGLDQIFSALDLLGEGGPYLKVGTMATKGIIIFLLGYFAFQPASIQTDMVAQFTPGPNKVAPVILLALFMGGCSSGSQARIEKTHMVFLEVVAGAKKVVVSGCDGLPTIQVAMDVVEPYMKGSDVVLMKVGEAAAVDLCAKVKAAQQAQVPR